MAGLTNNSVEDMSTSELEAELVELQRLETMVGLNVNGKARSQRISEELNRRQREGAVPADSIKNVVPVMINEERLEEAAEAVAKSRQERLSVVEWDRLGRFEKLNLISVARADLRMALEILAVRW